MSALSKQKHSFGTNLKITVYKITGFKLKIFAKDKTRPYI